MTREEISKVISIFIAWNGQDEPIDIDNIDYAIQFIEECLEKEQPQGLDEAAFSYENALWENGYKETGYCPQDVHNAFIAGVKWMAENNLCMTREQFDAANKHWYDEGVKDGRTWMAEQGEVIDGLVCAIGNNRWVDLDDEQLDTKLASFKNDDRVIVQIRKI